MRRFSRRVSAILVSVCCVSGAIAAEVDDCTDCSLAQTSAPLLDEDDGPHWLLSVTFDEPNTRFGLAFGVVELATPLERTLSDAGVQIDESWTIALRFEIAL